VGLHDAAYDYIIMAEFSVTQRFDWRNRMTSKKKAALVTGGRRNIGRGIALALAQAGYDVGINDIVRDEDAEETLALLRDRGADCELYKADISDSAQVMQMFASFQERFGGIDALVNNAYWAVHAPFLETDEEAWDRTIGVCLKGYFLCSQTAARAMIDQDRSGAIVSVSSVHSNRVWPTGAAYGVAKAGIERLTRSMAAELGPYGIRANAVLPGFVNTAQPFGEPPDEFVLEPERAKFIPAGRYATPEDIGRAAVFLLSSDAGNITGTALPVDGGFLVGGVP
jgi:NAD(P)-dependent dehydrogenase (short-subunit alcohol dehydrogenase family)